MSEPKVVSMPSGGQGYVFEPDLLSGRLGDPENAVAKACAAWVVNNGDLSAFATSLVKDGYSMVLIKLE